MILYVSLTATEGFVRVTDLSAAATKLVGSLRKCLAEIKLAECIA